MEKESMTQETKEAVDIVPETVKTDGEGDDSQTAGKEKEVDTEEAQRIAEKRKEKAERAAVTSYFRQQGLSPEEAKEAFQAFKEDREKKKAAEREDLHALQTKVAQYEKADSEAMRTANRRLVRAEAMIAAQRLHVRPDRIHHAIRLADLSGVDVDESGKVDSQALEEALETVCREIPELLITEGEENKPGFKLGGSGGQKPVASEKISAIFGNKKAE